MNDALLTVIKNLSLFFGGFFFCYALCKFGLVTITRWGEKKANAMNDQHHPGDEPLVRDRVVKGIIFLVIGVLVFGLGVYLGFRLLSGKIECFDQYANRAADSQEKRAALAERDSAAKTELLREIAALNTQSEEVTDRLVEAIRKADSVKDLQDILIEAGTSEAGDLTEVFEEFNRETDEIAREREEHPVPDPPREVC